MSRNLVGLLNIVIVIISSYFDVSMIVTVNFMFEPLNVDFSRSLEGIKFWGSMSSRSTAELHERLSNLDTFVTRASESRRGITAANEQVTFEEEIKNTSS